jgi:predicted nucleic acid-binding protein
MTRRQMVVCADTSFLFSLYGSDRHSPRALAWAGSIKVPLTVSTLNEYELANALRFAEFRKAIPPGSAVTFWSDYEADVAAGRLTLRICNLADVLAEARRLSASYTPNGCHRGFDILHVAAALRFGAVEFLTFDGNQKKLALAEGLQVPL